MFLGHWDVITSSPGREFLCLTELLILLQATKRHLPVQALLRARPSRSFEHPKRRIEVHEIRMSLEQQASEKHLEAHCRYESPANGYLKHAS